MDWSSAAFGAFMCLCMLIFLYDVALFAILRKQFLLWHAARTVVIAVLAASTTEAGLTALLGKESLRTLVQGASADLSVALLAPFVYFFLEREHANGFRRTALFAAGALALCSLAILPSNNTAPLFNPLHYALMSASLIALTAAIVSALIRGSRAAKFLSFALGTGIVLGGSTLVFAMINGAVLPNWLALILGALTLEFVITAAAVGDRLISVTREAESAREEARKAQKANRTDPLTGLPNRRALERMFEGKGSKVPDGIAIVDLDRFKDINDRFGHAIGDDVLVAAGQALGLDGVFAARLGGEEFILVLFGKDWAKQAERARRSIRTHVQREVPNMMLPVTASAGLASFRQGDTLSETMKRADLALYAAKQAGRDRSLALTFFEDHQPEWPSLSSRSAA
ncbi:diguanylate cyclase domain-containing protein [Altererythrobacter sp. MF3-039]|uniref:GGDEF domain-containing protein n=1 Tax=Altererythrobacter sp. MF3-039 TaxID=3252901 RepID=UPI00390C87F6